MTDITMLYSGFDTLNLAIQGALPEATLTLLDAAKEEAKRSLQPQPVSFGPGPFEAMVTEVGQKGGYSYRLERGPSDIKWAVKPTQNPRDWALFAMMGSDCLLTLGLEEAKRRLWQDLEAMGARWMDYSINRVDYAMDFKIRDFVLDTSRVLAHSHTTVKAHTKPDDLHFSYVSRGREDESITIGKMPGRQVIIYDKRREIIQHHKTHWFQVWGIDKADRSFDIYRVELRAGKHHLKAQWQIKSFEDLEDAIGDVFRTTTEKVRYLDDDAHQCDSNVSRQACHPLWLKVQDAINQSLFDHQSGLTEGQLKAAYRDQKIEMYRKSLIAHAAGLSVALDMADDKTLEDLPALAHDTLAAYIRENEQAFIEKRDRIKSKVRFLEKRV